jgi:hypothetical protein
LLVYTIGLVRPSARECKRISANAVSILDSDHRRETMNEADSIGSVNGFEIGADYEFIDYLVG